VRADLEIPAAEPPPADLLVSAYDLLHSTGLDFAPYVRLFERFRARVEGVPEPAGPTPGTFADGVATMDVLDAIRRSAREGRSVDLPR
jgi:predicted dehydrogenase